jgi:hypothetical protein
MGRTPMDHDAASRISAAAARDPESPTAQSGFGDRAEAAADRNGQDDDWGDE